MAKEKETNRYLCNQWQVGNFEIQKHVKAGPPPAFENELRKSCFWLWLLMTANTFGWAVGFWQKQKQGKAQPKAPLDFLAALPNLTALTLQFPTCLQVCTNCHMGV
jgi:hypothetical protein